MVPMQRLLTRFLLFYLYISVTEASIIDTSYHCGSHYNNKLPARIFCTVTVEIKLTLGFCKIKAIDKEAFACLEKIQEIWLQSNEISSLQAGVFRHLKTLDLLDISGG